MYSIGDDHFVLSPMTTKIKTSHHAEKERNNTIKYMESGAWARSNSDADWRGHEVEMKQAQDIDPNIGRSWDSKGGKRTKADKSWIPPISEQDKAMAASMVMPRFLSSKSVNASTIAPHRVGSRFTDEQKAWLQSRFGLSKTLRTYDIDGLSDFFDQFDWQESAGDRKARVAREEYEAKEKARRGKEQSILDGGSSTKWIDDTFGSDAMNEHNKARLVEFLDGTTKKFNGMISWKWEEGLRKAGAVVETDAGFTVDWKKLKSAYDYAKQSNTKPAEKAKEPTVKPSKQKAPAVGKPETPAEAAAEVKEETDEEVGARLAPDASKEDQKNLGVLHAGLQQGHIPQKTFDTLLKNVLEKSQTNPADISPSALHSWTKKHNVDLDPVLVGTQYSPSAIIRINGEEIGKGAIGNSPAEAIGFANYVIKMMAEGKWDEAASSGRGVDVAKAKKLLGVEEEIVQKQAAGGKKPGKLDQNQKLRARANAINIASGATEGWASEKAETPKGKRLNRKFDNDSEGKDVGVRSIVEFLNKSFGAMLIKSKSQTSARHPAHYRTDSGIIFSKDKQGQIIFHEAGHRLFEILDRAGKIDGELKRVLTYFLDSGLTPNASAENIHEAFAEWTRQFVTNHDSLGGWEAIETAVSDGDPQAYAVLKDAARAFTKHIKRAPIARFSSESSDRVETAPSNVRGTLNYILQKGVRGEHASEMVVRKIQRSIQQHEGNKKSKAARQQWWRKTGGKAIRSAHAMLSRVKNEVDFVYSGGVSGKNGVRVITRNGAEPLYLSDKSFNDIKTMITAKQWEAAQTAFQAKAALARYEAKGLEYAGLQNGVSPANLKQIVDDASLNIKNFDEAFEALNEYYDALLEVAVMSGEFSREDADRMKDAYEHYIYLRPEFAPRASSDKQPESLSLGSAGRMAALKVTLMLLMLHLIELRTSCHRFMSKRQRKAF